MNHLENEIISGPHSRYIRFWRSYVGDVICVWNGTDTQALSLLQTLNDFDSNMQFTLENAGDHLNYLDFSINLTEVNNVLQASFGIFRKTSFSGVSIHADSLHPSAHKMVVVNSAIHRLLNLPLSAAAIEDEILHIEGIASLNGLDINVRSLIQRRRLRSLLSNSFTSEPKRQKCLRLPFLGRASYKLAAELKHFGFRVGFYPLRTIGNLSSLKDRESTMEKSGVYRASCGVCNSVYVGQTCRKLSKRLHEHKTKGGSAIFSHCSNSGHDPDQISIALLHQCNKSVVMNILEEIETIKAAGPNLLNDIDAVSLHKFIRFYYNYNDSQSVHDN